MNNNYLPRKTFFWIMGFFILAFTTVTGYTIGQLDDTKDKFNHSFTQVTNSISSINTSLEFINEDIREIKEKI